MKLIKAIRYKNIDEAEEALSTVMEGAFRLFDDDGEDPQGLLTVVPDDEIEEKLFYRLVDARNGILLEVEKIAYSGYGPPAEEEDYMGFISRKIAYVLKGCCLPIEIKKCPQGAQDIHHLEAMVLDREHPIDPEQLAKRLELPSNWDFDHLFELILQGNSTAEEIDQLIHRDIQ
ncbi:MAG: hypothetical protein VYC91_04530 [Acidobacteriota bacterium]|nr:hypothetical protein [Acidobacteriota bacterium]